MDIGGFQVETGIVIVRILLFGFFFGAIFKYMGPECESIGCTIFSYSLKAATSFFVLMGIDRLIIAWYS